MASNPPPFQVEDTDEDFFDKLVEDDLAPSPPVGPKLDEGATADAAAKSLTSLTIEKKKKKKNEEEEEAFGFDGSDEWKDDLRINGEGNGSAAAEVKSDSALVVSKSNNEGGSGAKQVDWDFFNAKAEQNGSYSDFFNELGNTTSSAAQVEKNSTMHPNVMSGDYTVANGLSNGLQYQEVQAHQTGGFVEESKTEQDVNSTQYWDGQYPGWKLDPSTKQWYRVDYFETAPSDLGTNLQQTAPSVVETVTQVSTTAGWDQVSQGTTNGYPPHMLFYQEYPDLYWDSHAGEWRSLEAYHSSLQSVTPAQAQNDTSVYQDYSQPENVGSQGISNQGQDDSRSRSYSTYNQQAPNMWQPEAVATSEPIPSSGGNQQQLGNSYGSPINRDQQHNSTSPLYNKLGQNHVETNGIAGFPNFGGNFNQQFNQGNAKLNEQSQCSDDYYGSQKSVNYLQQSFQSPNQFSYAPSVERSSAGRPPHALVAFGFGGKLIVMKDNNSTGNSSYGSQDPVAASVSVLNLTEVLMQRPDASSVGITTCDYFRTLCQQSFPGPLVGGNVGSKELNKWIDERIANCESPDMDFRKGKVLRLLISLLKIACQHYGKLRSPFGTDTLSKENDTPESAVAKLFASAKGNGAQFGEYEALSHCVRNLPSEGQIRATASEVQNLLVSGRKKEALQCAQEGQLWGPALVLASQLGEQFYVDTVKKMAVCQLIAGSPLRTLCLLIAGQPAEVFSTDMTSEISVHGAVNTPQQPARFGSNKMLDDWEENLAVITANRTKDDELVIIHLGDTLWKDRSEITAAHICYLIAEANFESYSDTARQCLIGADHWKSPRTYASPDAIQRTELYEYSKVLGNSQFILLPFQPYKLIYAHMLAEVGRVSDSLKYCQIIMKSLKTVRAPEVETWKQLVLSLEERIRTHQQGGYSVNIVSSFTGKFRNFVETAHRVVGGLPPHAPSTSPGSGPGNNEHYQPPVGPRVSTSQSTVAMSSLIAPTTKPMHNRSVSEPDFGRTPRQVDSSKEISSPDGQGKLPGGSSRFSVSRFGFGQQLFQKTVGLVLRPGKQAKLGETNKFYYDEKLKRWVEEGAAPPAEEPALPPPPTTAAFQNGVSDYSLRSALKKDGSPTNELQTSTPPGPTSGTPPIPPSSNQFSARGRMGIRSRYVDTFNQAGGMPANLFQSPSVPSVKPAVAANAKCFIPTPASSSEPIMEGIAKYMQEDRATNKGDLSTSTRHDHFHAPPPSLAPVTMQRYPGMSNIQTMGVLPNANGPLPPHSRRTASWGGSSNDIFSPPPDTGEIKPLGEALGMSPALYRSSEPHSLLHAPMNGGRNFGDDLHEVEL